MPAQGAHTVLDRRTSLRLHDAAGGVSGGHVAGGRARESQSEAVRQLVMSAKVLWRRALRRQVVAFATSRSRVQCPMNFIATETGLTGTHKCDDCGDGRDCKAQPRRS
eukprot:242830-Pleurochrysis_carterae.AAC.1